MIPAAVPTEVVVPLRRFLCAHVISESSPPYVTVKIVFGIAVDMYGGMQMSNFDPAAVTPGWEIPVFPASVAAVSM